MKREELIQLLSVVAAAVIAVVLSWFPRGVLFRISSLVVLGILLVLFFRNVAKTLWSRVWIRGATLSLSMIIMLALAVMPRASLAVRAVEILNNCKVGLTDISVFLFKKRQPGRGFLLKQRGEFYVRNFLWEAEYYVLFLDLKRKCYEEAVFMAREERVTEEIGFHSPKPILVSFTEIYFELYKSFVDPEHEAFQEIDEYCHHNPGVRLVVVGYADTIDDRESNMEMAMERSLAVKEILVDGLVAQSSQILCLSCGEDMPRVDDGDNRAHKENRRVEVYAISPSPTYRNFCKSEELSSGNPSEECSLQSPHDRCIALSYSPVEYGKNKTDSAPSLSR